MTRKLDRYTLQTHFAAWVGWICFNKIILDIITVILYKESMRDATFFTHPIHDWQRRYEALRSSFVDRLPAQAVADRFGYTPGYVHLLRHQFSAGKIDFSEPVPEGAATRYRVTGGDPPKDPYLAREPPFCRRNHPAFD